MPEEAALLIHHDEDADVFINGRRVVRFPGYVTEYQVAPLDAQGRQALKAGENLLAVHCRQTSGGQFIDVHVVDADNVPELPAPVRPTTPFQSKLITEWGAQVTPENAWREYPRPMLERDQWTNLNGMWDYAITSRDGARPQVWDGEVLVPFCLESKLGGVQKLVNPEDVLWYRRTVDLTQPAGDRRLLLNFEAVDYHSQVWVNDTLVGEHTGGNVPFQLDITDAVQDGTNHIVLRVKDETGGAQLRGKQQLDPRGIWYTRVSGIWQTVWLEEVSSRHIEDLKLASDVSDGTLTVQPILAGPPVAGQVVRVVVLDGDEPVAEAQGTGRLTIPIPDAKLWSPDDPQLYNLRLTLLDAEGHALDEVRSYAGLREVGRESRCRRSLAVHAERRADFSLGSARSGMVARWSAHPAVG